MLMKRNIVAWAALAVSTAALVSSQGVTRKIPAALKVPAESQKTAKALSEAYVAVAEFVKPSVVQISIQRKATPGRVGGRFPFPGGPNGPQGMTPKELEELMKRFFPEGGVPEPQQFGGRGGPVQQGTGSGFVYDDQGHILTNNHVVEEAAKIVVTFHDGTELPAKVVGTDPEADVAVIKVDSTNYPALPRGESSKLKVGELVMAVGSPFGLSQSVTTGIISATDRDSVGINAYESFIQTDAAINPGNSGGPLINMDGQVVGVNSAIVTGSRGNDGVGFTIPIDMASTLADKLIKSGKVSRARVGIALAPLTPALAKQFGIGPEVKGVLVERVLPNSPAAKAGLKAGDLITGFNHSPVLSAPTFRLAVAASDAGKELELNYIREGKEASTKIVPAPAEEVVFETDKPKDATKEPAKGDVAKIELANFGLEVQDLSVELAVQFGFPKDAKGVLISDVKENSPAEAAGLKPGLLITRVVKNKKIQSVTTVKEFQEIVDKSEEVALYVEPANGQGPFLSLSKTDK